MANEKETTKTNAPAVDAMPQIVGDEKEHLFVSAHDMSDDVDPAFAGEYELTHGSLRIPVPDGKGGFIPRGKVYRAGAKVRLGAIDAYRFLVSGVVKRIDGRTPDRVVVAQERAA